MGEELDAVRRATVQEERAASEDQSRVHCAHKLDSVKPCDENRELSLLEFEDAAAVRARLAVGADGIRSKARRRLDDATLRYAGNLNCNGAPIMYDDDDGKTQRCHLGHQFRTLLTPSRGRACYIIDVGEGITLWQARISDEDGICPDDNLRRGSGARSTGMKDHALSILAEP